MKKKFLAILLTLVMVFQIAAPAFTVAEGPLYGTVTIGGTTTEFYKEGYADDGAVMDAISAMITGKTSADGTISIKLYHDFTIPNVTYFAASTQTKVVEDIERYVYYPNKPTVSLDLNGCSVVYTSDDEQTYLNVVNCNLVIKDSTGGGKIEATEGGFSWVVQSHGNGLITLEGGALVGSMCAIGTGHDATLNEAENGWCPGTNCIKGGILVGEDDNSIWNDHIADIPSGYEYTFITYEGRKALQVTKAAPVEPTYVAQIGDVKYETVAAALADITDSNYASFDLLDDSAWPDATPVFVITNVDEEGTFVTTLDNGVKSGSNTTFSGYAEGVTSIKLFCKPNSSVTCNSAHPNFMCDTTIYGFGATVSTGAEMAVDKYVPLTSDVTLKIYKLTNSAFWGSRQTDYTVNVYLIDCVDAHEIMLTGNAGNAIAATTNVTAKNCTFIVGNGHYAHNGVCIGTNYPGEVVIQNCSFTDSTDDFAININNKTGGSNEVEISGCTFTNCGNNTTKKKSAVRICGEVDSATLTATLSNLTFTNCTNTCDIEIGKGGSSSGNKSVVSYSINNTVGDLYVYTVNTDEKKVDAALTAGQTYSGNNAALTYVAQIGSVKYETLQAAVAAAQNGDTITLLANIELDKDVHVTTSGEIIYCVLVDGVYKYQINAPQLSSLTIDGDGHTISMANNAAFGSQYRLTDGCAFFFGKYGSNYANTGTVEGNYTIKNVTFTGFDTEIIRSGNATVNLVNCTFSENHITKGVVPTGNGSANNTSMIYAYQGALNVQGCTFVGNTTSMNQYGLIFSNNSNTAAKITINNSLFENNGTAQNPTLANGLIFLSNAASSEDAITNNTFNGNYIMNTSGNAAVVYLSKPVETFSGNLFIENHVEVTVSGKKEAVIVLGSLASETPVTGNAFVSNVLGETPQKRGTIVVGCNSDLSNNYWGDGAAAERGTGLDIYVDGDKTITNTNYATAYTANTAPANGVTVTLPSYVASLTHSGVTTEYESAQEALDRAVDGDTVTLYAGNHGSLYLRQNNYVSVGVDVRQQEGEEWGTNDRYRALSGVTIQGQTGATLEKIVFEAGSHYGTLHSNPDYSQTLDSFMEIDNLTISGLTFNSTGSPALDFNKAGNLRLTGLNVTNCTVNGSGNFGGAERLLYWTTAANHLVSKQNSTLTGVTKTDVDYTTGLSNLSVTNCVFNNLHQVMEIRGIQNFTFTGNRIDKTYSHALLCVSDTAHSIPNSLKGTVTVSGNTADQVGDRFFRTDKMLDATVTLTNNIVTNSGKSTRVANTDASLVAMDNGSNITYTVSGNSWNGNNDEVTVPNRAYFRADPSVWTYVAEIGETKYTTLAAAIADANATQSAVTIKLLDHCDTGAATIGNPLVLTNAGATLDLDGKTITVNKNFSFVLQGDDIEVKNGSLISAPNAEKKTGWNSYILVVNDCDGVKLTGLTMQGGISIGGSQSDWGTTDAPKAGIAYQHGAAKATNVTIANCNVTSGDYYAVCSQMGSDATIESGTYVSNQNAVNSVGNLSPAVIYGRFTNTDGPEGYIYVTGGNFNGKIGTVNKDWIVISGGYFTVEPESGLIKAGHMAISNLDNATSGAYPYTVAQVESTVKDNTETVAVQEVTYGNSQTAMVITKDDTSAVVTIDADIDSSVSGAGSDVDSYINVPQVLANAIKATNNVSVDGISSVDVELSLSKTPVSSVENNDTFNAAIANATKAFELHPVATVTINGTSKTYYDVSNSELAENASFTTTLSFGEAAANKNVTLTHYASDGTQKGDSWQATADASGNVEVTLTSFSYILGVVETTSSTDLEFAFDNDADWSIYNYISKTYLNVQDQLYFTVQFHVSTKLGDNWKLRFTFAGGDPVDYEASKFIGTKYKEQDMKVTMAQGVRYTCDVRDGNDNTYDNYYEIRQSIYPSNMDKVIKVEILNNEGTAQTLYVLGSGNNLYSSTSHPTDFSVTTNSYLTELAGNSSWTTLANTLKAFGEAAAAKFGN